VRRESVGEELRNDGGLGDDLIFEVGVCEFDRGDESALEEALLDAYVSCDSGGEDGGILG
jgi:hypothetical protein